MKKITIRVLKITGISVGSLLLLMFLLPILFPGPVERKIKAWVNHSITGEFNFSKARLSFFRHFPSLTLTMYDFSLKGSAPFANDTLLAGKELGFGFNLASLLKSQLEVSKFYLNEALINVQVDSAGNANYNIYKGSADTTAGTDSSNTRLRIEGIYISNSKLVYNDRSMPMLLQLEGLDYKGAGDLHKSNFDLSSKLHVESADFMYDNTSYVEKKQLNAELVTGINTSSLNFKFSKNDIFVNKLPVSFRGDMTILKDGYDIDLDVVSGTTDFGNVFSALPAAYNQWFADTKFSGTSQVKIALKGSYRAATGQQPDFKAHLWVNDGSINYKNAPAPLQHFFIGADFQMPELNPDKMVLQVDSLLFSLNNEPTRISLRVAGLETPLINAKTNSRIDLDLLNRSLGIPGYHVGGKLQCNATLDGKLDMKNKRIPATKAALNISNGSIQTPYYQHPVEKLEMNTQIDCSTGSFNNLAVDLQPISFQFEGQPFSIQAALKNFENLSYDIDAKGTLDLGKIYQVFAVKGYKLIGLLQADLSLHGTQEAALKGQYQQLKNSGTLSLKNLEAKSDDYPYPFVIPEGTLRFDRDKAWLKNLLLQYHTNEFRLNGFAQNYIGYYLEGSTLKGNLSVASPNVLVDDFMAFASADSNVAKSSDTATASGVVMIPTNLDIALNAAAKSVSYSGVAISNFRGNVLIQQGKMVMNNTGFNIAGAGVTMNATYAPTDTRNADFEFTVKADSFDIKRAYDEIPMVKEMMSSAANTKGIVSLDYALKGKLDDDMMPVYPSIKGKGALTLENLQVNGMKLFGAVSKATGKDSMNNPTLKAVVIKSSIGNNIITIERTKMKVYGFRPRVEGQVSLDGKLNLRFRLGLPPFGIIGIPMTITGTSDHPIIKMHRGNVEDALEKAEEEQ